ncbi:MAG: energy transducer TonB [Bacteroidales bacterium]|nr:energy transducer TonB [Bacteroidales bacterium]MBN2763703.1 energy transducer TonB [Bacteroidales bacterium]
METKKTHRANLENKRSLFLQFGLILTLSAILIAFEWSTPANDTFTDWKKGEEFIIDDLPPISRHEVEKKEPLKPEITLIDIVPDDEPVLEDPVFADASITENTGFDIRKWTSPPDEGIDKGDNVFYVVEDMPVFKGGDLTKFWEYIQNHVKYPALASDMGLQGKVTVTFIVDQTGKITDIKIIKGIHPLLDDEVVKALSGSPSWVPGKQRGKPVKVAFSMPVIFKLKEH